MGKTISPVVLQESVTKIPRGKLHSESVPEENTVSGKNGIVKRSHQKKHAKKQTDEVKYKDKNQLFQYGNYNRYYGYRNLKGGDPRLHCMKKRWFENVDVLDVGCNVGHLTLEIAKKFAPRKIIGLDIDSMLIKAARRNVRHYISKKEMGDTNFPVSVALSYGPLAVTSSLDSEGTSNFPNNVFFVEGNYVLETDELLEIQRPEFDMILCLSLTKWIHLNWGDSGLKRAFRRMYSQLRPGGRMVLEAQSWETYRRKRKLTETIHKNYTEIKFHPEQFNEYLLSEEVGFSKCKLIDTPAHPSKGFCRPMYLFTKKVTKRTEVNFNES